MKRLAYVQTARGQKSQYERRSRARRRFIIMQPLRSKNSMKAAEKTAFQHAVLADLEHFGNPTFRADLVAELHFYSNQNDPPQLHTLAKNYLDLFGSSQHLPGAARKHLAYRDDRQVKVLSVSYHLQPTQHVPSLHAEIGRLSDLRHDLALVERIHHGDFERDEDAWRRRRSDLESSPFARDREERVVEELDAAFETYRDVMRDNRLRHLSADVVATLREVEQQHLQERYLAWTQLVVRRTVLSLLSAVRGGTSVAAMQDAVANMGRQVLLSDPITLSLSHAPVATGDSAKFQSAVSAALEDFSKRLPWLLPLRVPVSALVLIVPPPNGIDLDNLARKIIPLVHDRWQPPRTQLSRIDVAQISDPRLRALISAQLEAERRFPRTSLTRYEVVELPRSSKDPRNGFVRIALGSGSPETLRNSVDDVIEKWADSFD